MPEYHPGTDIEIPDAIAPANGFRNAIPNSKRYMKQNTKDLETLCNAAYECNDDLLEELLSTGDEMNLFNGDVNAHCTNLTALHFAAMAGNVEGVQLLLQAKADPHMRECMPYGKDPEEGKTALDLAKESPFESDEITELLTKAMKETPLGWYVLEGPSNNEKMYGCWEWGNQKPPKGWYLKRPGVKERMGLATEKKERKPPTMAAPVAKPSVAKAAEKKPAGPPPLPIGLLFPGQGSQYVKMMSGVKDIPKVQEYLKTSKDILGFDVLDVCLNGPESKLEETSICQPCMFIAGLAGLEKLRGEREEAVTRAQVMAGLSLGEYTALCAAGVFTFEDGLKLVKLRGAAMQEAASKGKQLMLSVAGLDKKALEDLCAQAAKKEGSGAVCGIANELFPKGFSCAGTEKAINELKSLTEKAGALQAKILKTAGAFHTSLMSPAQEKLGKALDETLPKMSSPSTQVYMNATAEAVGPDTDPKKICDLLKKQLVSSVLWEASVRAMIKDGVKEFYEVGPMKQIKAMMKRINQEVWKETSNIEV
eukprot:gnl/TRDRNA2_/TRDRNA2_151310_c0_seq2.p1 gnl/TRDRNA2_/TRDRNA2_151310_c0~~gnl/TRDRNA2_/TRDRNA2_151310_c0_seq2.p1  ORF type:complete len:537 (-),score=162.35 gnl/TRDRNA2_/TRDRNA2_151310_c0_seq2:165-1775(-)